MRYIRFVHRAWIKVEHFGGRCTRFEKTFLDKADACRWIINCLPQAQEYATSAGDRIVSGIADDCQKLYYSMVCYSTNDVWYPKGTRAGANGLYTTEKAARQANERHPQSYTYPTETVLETVWKTISRDVRLDNRQRFVK